MNNYSNPVTVTGNPASFEASGNGKLLSLSVPFSPIQDLHGYSSPWPAGGGKNLLPLTVDGIKYENAGTWVDNTYSNNGVTFTILTDNSGNVIGIQASGTATGSNASLRLPLPTNISVGDSVVLNGNPRQSTPATRIWVGTSQYADIAADIGLGTTFTYSESVARIWVQVMRDNTVNGVIYTPMIRLSTETDATFSPYSNICPISGRTGLSVYVGPTQDQQDATTYAVDWTDEAGTVYGGTDEVVGGVLTDEWAEIPSYNGEAINEPWLSSMDAYTPGATPTTGAQVVYELATPLTYQLTPQEVELLLGENYLWESSGADLSLTYYADGNANTLDALNLMLGNRYVNNHTPDDVSDREALDILLGR